MLTRVVGFLGLDAESYVGSEIPLWYGVPAKVRAKARWISFAIGLTVGVLIGLVLETVWIGLFSGSTVWLLSELLFERSQFHFDAKYAAKKNGE